MSELSALLGFLVAFANFCRWIRTSIVKVWFRTGTIGQFSTRTHGQHRSAQEYRHEREIVTKHPTG